MNRLNPIFWSTSPYISRKPLFYSQYINSMLTSSVYPGQRRGVPGIQTDYSKNTHNGDVATYPRKVVFGYAANYIFKSLRENGTVYDAMLKLYKNRVPNKQSGKQACGKFCFSEEAVCQFSEKVCAVEIRNLTGPPDKEWLQLNFDDSHEFTRNLMDFHEKFGPFLDSIRTNKFEPVLLR